MNNDLMKTKYEVLTEEIEKITSGLLYTFDDYGFFVRELNGDQAVRAYNEILDNLDMIPDLSEDEKKEFRELLEQRIKETPEVEKQENLKYIDRQKKKEQEWEAKEQEKEQAFNKARERWEKLSFWEKRKYRKRNMHLEKLEKFNYNTSAPEYQSLGIRTINSLYQMGGGKDDR